MPSGFAREWIDDMRNAGEGLCLALLRSSGATTDATTAVMKWIVSREQGFGHHPLRARSISKRTRVL